ncbi:MAG: restriction endonuclease subunit S [Symploca sp. SIO3C6]|nr:restriction endonuclease subunit S [Symploca sp. SIO3C6]
MSLPNEWSLVSLNEVAAPEKGAIRRGPFGGSIKKEIFVADGYKVYEQQNAIESNFEIGHYFIDEQKFQDMEGFSVKANDLIISCAGTIGRIAIVPSDARPGIINQALMRIRPNTSVIMPRYLKWFLESPIAKRDIFGQVAGTALKNLAAISEIKKSQIPLPPLEEQRRIAAILDKADEVRRKRKQAIALTEELLKSAFLKIVGSKNPDYHQWKEVVLAELALPVKGSMRTGPFGSTLLHSEFVDEGIAVLGIDNAVQNRFAWGERRFITSEKYKSLKRYTIKPGDVIITIMGTTGRSAVVPEDIPTAINTKHLAAITLDNSKALPEYVSNAIHQDPFVLHQIALRNRGAIMAGLNLGIIKELKVRLPPLDQQVIYSKVIKQIRQKQEKLERAANDTNNLFNSLLQKAFRGEL